MNSPRSALLTTVGRTSADFDASAIAADLGLRHLDLVSIVPATGDDEPAPIRRLIVEDPLAAGPALIEGTGNVSYDSEAAAALGIPVIFIVDKRGLTEKLAVREAGGYLATVGGVFTEGELTADAIAEALTGVDTKPVMSPDYLQTWLQKKAQEKTTRIVLPEGDDDRILQAAHEVLAEGICELMILGDKETVTSRASALGLDISRAEIIDHLTDPRAEEFAAQFAELRKKKGVTLEQARETMKDVSYFGTMLVHTGQADGMVSGAAHTTAHTIRPSFQIIKTKPGTSVVSSIFLMAMRGRLWAFGDCAVNPNPTAEQIGEIAAVSAQTAAAFDIDPKVAILSYSTGTSGAGPDVDRAVAATAKAKELAPDTLIDGPLQFDAAVDPGVAAKKAPESPVAGKATVMIFPDLEAGNIGYKTAQRTGGALAIGPILQGLNKPVNDLSRGATVPDIINTIAITAIQAGETK
ncbi:phosphate acetyltransferase [Corynebacterium glucuronolyticum]|uniref:Phosphate acetyltransferase n=2 Tax=Corynebacterium glucuronolyticum TaxID=39791 RepID=A0AAX1L902_9CORY|nr:phosphate acetyltransferase [Corynebacterium glucuronolyticum]EEI64379.1 phosphate acetyltransferase [Corynebacterium glucuronolyticum ATCC 51866]QRP70329.1 phosphate acetyltransferase [Corynebacterium glucuronolyticum]